MNILFTCAGRRTYLLKYFRENLSEGEEPDQNRNEGHAAYQVRRAEGEAHLSRHVVDPDAGEEKPQKAAQQPLQN